VYTFVGQGPTSLCRYSTDLTPTATLALLTLIFGALVARSIHIRRRRNAAILAAIAAGTYVPPPNSKWRDDPLAPKPMLWEVHISLSQDLEKGWTTILVRTPTSLEAHSILMNCPARSWRHARTRYTAGFTAQRGILMVPRPVLWRHRSPVYWSSSLAHDHLRIRAACLVPRACRSGSARINAHTREVKGRAARGRVWCRARCLRGVLTMLCFNDLLRAEYTMTCLFHFSAFSYMRTTGGIEQSIARRRACIVK
jgi:hypothetical protein